MEATMEKEERKESEYEQCKGPLNEDCEKCKELSECLKYLNWDTRIPQWVLDGYLAVLSGTAFKVFMYLARKANYHPHSPHFGRCWPSRSQIAEATGVSKTNLSRQLIELEDHDLIRRSEAQHFYKREDGSFGSTVTITVTFFGRMKALKEKKK
jgi:DNA-binding MarR family transcriptional regulator